MSIFLEVECSVTLYWKVRARVSFGIVINTLRECCMWEFVWGFVGLRLVVLGFNVVFFL